MKKYESYKDANKHGESDVWSGCGKQGRCMPCGHIHDFGYSTDGHWISQFCCWQNHEKGCPDPKPKPIHKFNEKGKCSRCGLFDEIYSLKKKFSNAQINLIKKAAEKDFHLYNAEYITAHWLEKKGLGIIKQSSFKLTEKGLEIAKKFGFFN